MTLWLWLLTCLEPNKDFAIPFIFESLLKYWPHVNPFIYRFFRFHFFPPKSHNLLLYTSAKIWNTVPIGVDHSAEKQAPASRSNSRPGNQGRSRVPLSLVYSEIKKRDFKGVIREDLECGAINICITSNLRMVIHEH
jgi:hypothetical protein